MSQLLIQQYLNQLAAKSIAHPDPTRGAVSGVHVRRVIERLGITQEVNAKAKLTKPPWLNLWPRMRLRSS